MGTRQAILLALLLAAPATATATEEFPRIVAAEVGMTGPPPCSVCHLADMEARYSVRTPFGRALRVRGLVAYDDQSLVLALSDLRDQQVDSDGDGISDTDELLDGTDPNLPEGLDPMPDVSYGCATAGRPRAAGAAALVLLALAVLVARRARARRDPAADRAGPRSNEDREAFAACLQSPEGTDQETARCSCKQSESRSLSSSF